MIHKTAIIDSKAKISTNVKIGPYSVIGPNVEIGDDVEIQSHVNITGHTKIGIKNKIYPMASIGKVIVTLAGMIALILFLAYWAKRLQGMNKSGIAGMSSANGQAIQTLATISLGLKEKVSLIQVGEQQLLIGITAHSIQTLLVLDEPIKQDDIEKQTPVFQAILNKALNKA